MSKSIKRVEKAAFGMGLSINVVRMPDSTRTAVEAATMCDCEVGQIVKSLVFEGEVSGELILLLVSGSHEVDLVKASQQIGQTLKRADPKRIRTETGFAIGGVAPFGHINAPQSWLDEELLSHDCVWAAAGAPNSVFEINSRKLLEATGSKLIIVS